jgi:hypothetical protein
MKIAVGSIVVGIKWETTQMSGWTYILSKCLLYIYINQHAFILLVKFESLFSHTVCSTRKIGNLGINLRAIK